MSGCADRKARGKVLRAVLYGHQRPLSLCRQLCHRRLPPLCLILRFEFQILNFKITFSLTSPKLPTEESETDSAKQIRKQIGKKAPLGASRGTNAEVDARTVLTRPRLELVGGLFSRHIPDSPPVVVLLAFTRLLPPPPFLRPRRERRRRSPIAPPAAPRSSSSSSTPSAGLARGVKIRPRRGSSCW